MKQIIVNVSGLTTEEKQRVNEALAKIKGFNKMTSNLVTANWMYAPSSYADDKITNSDGNKPTANKEPTHTPQQVLEMAGMAKQGHIHARLMAQYAEDAKTTDKPWELWQIKVADKEWRDLTCNPSFATHLGYRRKPKTHIVSGVEVPDLRIEPRNGQEYWYPDASIEDLAWGTVYGYEQSTDSHRLSNNLCYKPTEEGRQAAILHAKAWLGIA